MLETISAIKSWMYGSESTVAKTCASEEIGVDQLDREIAEHQIMIADNEKDESRYLNLPYKQSETDSASGFITFYRLVGAWFISVAAGSVLVSIPIAVAALPLVCIVAASVMLIAAFLQWLFKMWIQFIYYCLSIVKMVLYTPNYLFSFAGSLLIRFKNALFKETPKISELKVRNQRLPPPARFPNRFLNTKTLDRTRPLGKQFPEWQRADDLRSIYEPSGRIIKKSLVTSPRTVRNPQFLFLTPEDDFRLSLCSELYAATTNMQPDDFLIRLGRDEENQNHYVLSIWDEPEIVSQLNFNSIIGFCEYIVRPDCPEVAQIDKLSISSIYSENGFSRLMIRKLMHMPNIGVIRVWSVWQAESFYKSLGFRNVFGTKDKDQLPTKIEGEHGPLLLWVSSLKKECRFYEQPSLTTRSSVPSFRSADNIPPKETRDTCSLKSKDSRNTILGGVGAYSCI